MSDALETVLRIRKLTVDEAKRSLAASLSAEESARVKADAAEALIGSEGEIAADITVGDGAVEAYAAWLPIGRANATAARAAHEESLIAVTLARAGLSAARAAAEAALTMVERREAERALQASRRDQGELDEIASQQAARAGKQ